MSATALWLGIACIIALYVGAALISIIFIPRTQYPIRTLEDPNAQLQYDESRNKARQTIVQIVIGAGFVFSFIAAAIGHANVIAVNDAKKQQDALNVYTASQASMSVSTRIIQLDWLARIAPEGFHDVAYTDIIRSIPPTNGMPCDVSDERRVDTGTALLLLAGRIAANDRTLYLMLEDKCLSGVRLDRLGDNRQFGHGLRNANFSGSQLHSSDFSGLDLSGAFFMGIQAGDYEVPGWPEETKTRNLQQRETNGEPMYRRQRRLYLLHFVGATLKGTHFEGAILAGADFSNADLRGARFDRANISRADFRGSNVKWEQLATACHGYIDHEPDDNKKALPVLNVELARPLAAEKLNIPLCGPPQ